jgi:hypothetical protein
MTTYSILKKMDSFHSSDMIYTFSYTLAFSQYILADTHFPTVLLDIYTYNGAFSSIPKRKGPFERSVWIYSISKRIAQRVLLLSGTQLVKKGWTYCKKYLNRGMDSHRLPCGVVQLFIDLPKKLQKFDKPLELHVKGFHWSMTFPKKFQNFPKT